MLNGNLHVVESIPSPSGLSVGDYIQGWLWRSRFVLSPLVVEPEKQQGVLMHLGELEMPGRCQIPPCPTDVESRTISAILVKTSFVFEK